MTVADSNHVWKRTYYLGCKINAGVFAKAQGCKIISVKEHNLCILFFFYTCKGNQRCLWSAEGHVWKKFQAVFSL